MVRHLQIEKIDKKYDEITALDSVTLDVMAGKVIALVGVNGSGKTTLLSILAGLDEPDNGDVIIDYKKLRSQKLRKISTMVFQKNAMFNKRVYDNVSFGLKIRKLAKEDIEKKVTEALFTVGLNGFQKRNAKKLSSGEQQRIALARALVIEPEILLLDEPTSNLDPSNAIIIEDIIKEMGKRNSCVVILATHNLHQAKRLSNEIVHIHYGKILEISSPNNFFKNPTNQITRKFIDGGLQF